MVFLKVFPSFIRKFRAFFSQFKNHSEKKFWSHVPKMGSYGSKRLISSDNKEWTKNRDSTYFFWPVPEGLVLVLFCVCRPPCSYLCHAYINTNSLCFCLQQKKTEQLTNTIITETFLARIQIKLQQERMGNSIATIPEKGWKKSWNWSISWSDLSH